MKTYIPLTTSRGVRIMVAREAIVWVEELSEGVPKERHAKTIVFFDENTVGEQVGGNYMATSYEEIALMLAATQPPSNKE